VIDSQNSNAKNSEPVRAIRVVNPLVDSNWDAKIGVLPGVSIFHTVSWARTLQETYGFRPIYFVYEESGKIQGLLPIMEVDSWLRGRRAVGLPFTDECAPLTTESGSLRLLCDAALGMAEKHSWKYLEVRGGQAIFGETPASTLFFGHRLDLSIGEAALLSQISKSARGAIKKAEKSDLTIEFSRKIEAVQVFYNLLCLTRKRHGVPPQPFSFFTKIHEHILEKELGWLILARHRGVPVAGGVFFHFGRAAMHKFGASDEKFQSLSANNLVLWEAIKWYASHHYAYLDLGRTSADNAGLRKFKMAWGTVERSITYFRYDVRTSAVVSVPDAASGWHNHIFRLMPISASKAVGALLYKHVA